MKVSACICTKNEEKMLPGLLDNLLGHVDEIVIVDGGSTDNTLDIATKFTDSIYTGNSGHPDGDRHIYVEEAKNDRLLVLDADERLCPALIEQLRYINNGPDGYWIARRNYYDARFNTPIVVDDPYTPAKIVFERRGGYYRHIIYPDYQLRLYDRRSLVRINDQIHSRPVIDGWTMKLPENQYIIHNNPIFSDRQKYRRYATVQALEHPGRPDKLMALYKFGEWMGFALKNGCWMDGPRGLKMAYDQALYHYWLYNMGYTPSKETGDAGEIR